MAEFLRRYRSTPLLLSILLLIWLTPELGLSEAEGVSWGLFFSVAIGFSGYWMAASRRWLVAISCLSFLSIAASLGSQVETWIAILHCLAVILLFGSCLFLAIRFSLLKEGIRALDGVIAGISGYFLLALVFANLYRIFLILHPESIQDLSSGAPLRPTGVVYYSLVTLTTQGYGDVLPLTPHVRLAAALEGACGTIYIAVFIAVVVSELRIARNS
ncbi:MAG: potassium channel family protein [Verrucomicrobiota bacterium]